MRYPEGYEPAEHRRALDAMLADMFNPQPAKTVRREQQARHDPLPGVVGSLASDGSCNIVLRIAPESIHTDL